MSQPIVLLDGGGFPIFILKVVKIEDHYADVEVLQVVAWDDTESKKPVETDPYLRATIKWDGCSNVYFGTVENGRPDGYLHICGATFWKQHCRVMEWVYKETTKLIKDMSKDEMWGDDPPTKV